MSQELRNPLYFALILRFPSYPNVAKLLLLRHSSYNVISLHRLQQFQSNHPYFYSHYPCSRNKIYNHLVFVHIFQLLYLADLFSYLYLFPKGHFIFLYFFQFRILPTDYYKFSHLLRQPLRRFPQVAHLSIFLLLDRPVFFSFSKLAASINPAASFP